MHYHLEIILPPQTEDIEAAVKSVMAPFYENAETEEHSTRHAFWDFYVIGGRFAGNKLVAALDQDKVKAFNEWCIAFNLTVSRIQSGKQRIDPASQIPAVDAKWNELFPREDGVMVPCPLFAHSNDQYGCDGKGTIEGDIAPLGQCLAVECSHIIFAGPVKNYETDEYTAHYMLSESLWNGVTHVKAAWDGTIGAALDEYVTRLQGCNDEYRQAHTPTDDWLAVTVDYHS